MILYTLEDVCGRKVFNRIFFHLRFEIFGLAKSKKDLSIYLRQTFDLILFKKKIPEYRRSEKGWKQKNIALLNF